LFVQRTEKLLALNKGRSRVGNGLACQRKLNVLEVSVGDAVVEEVVDGIEDDSDEAMQNSKPS